MPYCSAAALAREIPDAVSWSVTAATVTPASCAIRMVSSGENCPSEQGVHVQINHVFFPSRKADAVLVSAKVSASQRISTCV